MMLSFVFRSTMSLAACLVPRSVQDVPVRLIAGRPSRRIGGATARRGRWGAAGGVGDAERRHADRRHRGAGDGARDLVRGQPDTVYEQIMSFYKAVGGFGHLTMVAGPAS